MIERLNIIDVTANLEEQWVIDNKPNKPIFKYNKRNEEEEVSKDLTLNIDTIHVYPASVTRFIEHFLMPASSFTLVSGSQESIMSFEDSDVSTFNFCTIPLIETKKLKKKEYTFDSICKCIPQCFFSFFNIIMSILCQITNSSDLDSSIDEPSSGYQTSEIKSPQMKNLVKQTKTNISMPTFGIVYHCSDTYRHNLFMSKFDIRVENVSSEEELLKKHAYISMENFAHYYKGNIFEVSKQCSLLINIEKNVTAKVDGLMNVSPTNIALNPLVVYELSQLVNLVNSFNIETDMMHSPDSSLELWTQTKLNAARTYNAPKNPVTDNLNNLSLLRLPKVPVNMKIEFPMISMVYSNLNNERLLATKIKMTGDLKKFQDSCEFQGNAKVDCVVKNTSLNRWQHLYHANGTNNGCTDISINAGFLDCASVLENLEEVPLVSKGIISKYRKCMKTIKKYLQFIK